MDYIAADWRDILQHNGLDSFDALWDLDAGWFEEPNVRRGGWSGVSQAELVLPGGGRAGVFIKRQQDHITRTLAHPLTGVLTFRREFQNLNRLHACGVPTLDVLYFAERKVDGKRRSILITRALTGYRSLEDCIQDWQQAGWPDKRVWHRFITRLAGIARRMHQHRIQHNCFFPKHIFLKDIDSEPDIRLIDLEKAKHTFSFEQAMLRDLDTLNRRSPGVTVTERLRFLLAYYGERRVDSRVRTTWKKLVGLMHRKGRSPVGR